MTGALEGLRVLDFTTTFPGALVTQLFSDFGAEVVMVEPRGGNPMRNRPAAPFWFRGKKSIKLDLKDPADQDVARTLALGSDVVVETWRPGVAERLGLGYDELATANPGLVYGSITGFRRDGPYAQMKGYDGVVMAKIGSMGPLRLSDRPGPSFCATPAASFSSAQTLLHGLLAALYERENSGAGQHVETTLWQGLSAHDCWNWLQRMVAARYPDAYTAVPRVNETRRVPNGWLSFRLLIGLSKDGRWMQFSQTSERLWLAFMRVLGLEYMLTDPEWKDAHSSDDIDKRESYWENMLEAVRSKTVAEWYEIFDQEPNVFAEIFRTGTELLHHPQILHDGQAVTIEDTKLGPVLQPAALVKMRSTPAELSRPAPGLDENGDELRRRMRAEAHPVKDAPPVGQPPLAGVTVVELGTFYAGPFGSTILADLGARVIKFELLDGDPMRTIVAFPEVGAVKVLSGKESVALDIGTPEGKEIVYEAVRRAHIVLRSFRAGVAERLGYDDASLLKINPDLVYLNAPGFGVDGPYGHRPAYAPTIGAGAGQAGRNLGAGLVQSPDLTMDQVKEYSLRLGGAAMSGSNPDANSSLVVGTGMLLGLLAKKRGAPGQSMLTTMLNTMAHVLSEDMVEYEGRAPHAAVDAGIFGLGPLYRIYPAADDTWVFLAAPAPEEWDELTGALAGYADLAGDDRFSSQEARNSDELASALGAIFATRPAAAWEQELTPKNVACVAVEDGPPEACLMEGDAPVAGIEGQLVQLEHPVLGAYARLKPLASFSRSQGLARGAPLLGQDTESVLAELGYDEATIEDLRSRGIVA
jgi:crotonobetainyl-CoA:carnitine CoA-transferase CaiB-like acyl-CoA transferase